MLRFLGRRVCYGRANLSDVDGRTSECLGFRGVGDGSGGEDASSMGGRRWGRRRGAPGDEPLEEATRMHDNSWEFPVSVTKLDVLGAGLFVQSRDGRQLE